MSDGQPIRGGFFRGFLVGLLLSLIATAGLTILFPLPRPAELAPSPPPEVSVDVPATGPAPDAESATPGEAAAMPEPAAAEPAVSPVVPEPTAEPDVVSQAEPLPADTRNPDVVSFDVVPDPAGAAAPDVAGFSADVTTPIENLPQPAPGRRNATDLQAAEMNAMLQGPDSSFEPMIPLEPYGGELSSELDLGGLGPADVDLTPIIPLEAELGPMITLTPDVETVPLDAVTPDVETVPLDAVIEPDLSVAPDVEIAAMGSMPAEVVPEAAVEPVGDAAAAAGTGPAPADPAVTAEAGATAGTAQAGAIAQYATAFEDAGAKSLLAVVLLDSGENGLDPQSLAKVGMPLTIGIASDGPDAIARTLLYRAAGFEVVAIAPKSGVGAFRRGQNAADLPLQLEAIFSAVPEAVAVMDPPGGELPKDTQLVRALLAQLAASGHALLTQSGGLNSVDDLADEAKVPSGMVTRDIDAVDSVDFAMSRAAMQASQTGSAVIMGNTSPEMVQAIVQWLVSPSARSISLAPVSAAVTLR